MDFFRQPPSNPYANLAWATLGGCFVGTFGCALVLRPSSSYAALASYLLLVALPFAGLAALGVGVPMLALLQRIGRAGPASAVLVAYGIAAAFALATGGRMIATMTAIVATAIVALFVWLAYPWRRPPDGTDPDTRSQS